MSIHSDDSVEKSTPKKLNRQIRLYALAASAAGVGVLALAQPAQGELAITKKAIPIPVSPEITPHGVGISMTNNGINNFSFALVSYLNSVRSDRAAEVWGVGSRDGVMVVDTFAAKAMALPRGAKIGPSANFLSLSGYADLVERTENGKYGTYSVGYWGGNAKNRYIGVRFQISGETHYGWIRLTVTTDPNRHHPSMSAEITAYAYETVPNKPIKAGTAATAALQSPPHQAGPSLGMLGLGAEGMPLWRREEASVLP